MSNVKTYYKAVFKQAAEHEIGHTKKVFKAGETFVSRMSDANVYAFLSEPTAVKLIGQTTVSFPITLFDIYKVTETTTYAEEKTDIKNLK